MRAIRKRRQMDLSRNVGPRCTKASSPDWLPYREHCPPDGFPPGTLPAGRLPTGNIARQTVSLGTLPAGRLPPLWNSGITGVCDISVTPPSPRSCANHLIAGAWPATLRKLGALWNKRRWKPAPNLPRGPFLPRPTGFSPHSAGANGACHEMPGARNRPAWRSEVMRPRLRRPGQGSEVMRPALRRLRTEVMRGEVSLGRPKRYMSRNVGRPGAAQAVNRVDNSKKCVGVGVGDGCGRWVWVSARRLGCRGRMCPTGPLRCWVATSRDRRTCCRLAPPAPPYAARCP